MGMVRHLDTIGTSKQPDLSLELDLSVSENGLYPQMDPNGVFMVKVAIDQKKYTALYTWY